MNKNLMYKVLVIILITISMLLIGTIEAKAAGTSLTATKQNAYVGDDVKINLSFTAAAWNLKISGNGITGKSYAAQTSDLSEVTNGDSFTLNTTSAGKYKIVLKGDITDQNGVTIDVEEEVTVIVEEEKVTPEPPSNTDSNNNTGSDAGSNNNTDSNGGSNNNEGSGSDTGSNAGTNNNTGSDSNTSSTPKSNNANLKSLWVKPSEYDFTGFKANILEYTAKDVPNEIDTIKVGATLDSEKARIVSGTGNIKLNVGLNELPIKVKAEDGTEKTYIIKITRKEAEVEEQTEEEKIIGLKTLTIAGLKLSPEFDSKVYNYTAKLTEDLEKLEIKTEGTLENSKIEITGNENLKDGENIITIIVTNDSTEEIATYQIVVNKEVEEIVATVGNTENNEIEEEENVTKQPIPKIYLILAAIIVVAIIILLITIKSGNSKNKKIKEEDFEEDVDDSNNNLRFEEFTQQNSSNPFEQEEINYNINTERDNNAVEKIFGKKGKHS